MKKLRWTDYISINLFWLGLNIRNTAIGSVFIPYLVDAFVNPEVKNTYLGLLRTSGLVIAMLVQPAAGLLSDRNTSRFGRRRPYIFVGVLLDLVFLAAVAVSNSYWMLFVVLLFQQITANISHGPLQGLIPDLVPEEERGRASGVKAIFELIPIVLITFTVARMVGAGLLGWGIAATGAGLLLTMILTMIFVHEKPLIEKPTTSMREPMLRVFGMLAGIAIGAIAGLLAGGLLGGISGLIAWPLVGRTAATALGISIGGIAAMVIAVLSGVWAGALGTLGQDARRQSSFTWWIVNRLLFLAAITSIQGFAPFFLMSAFKVDRGEAIVMTANLTMVVGLFTLVTALPGGWLADHYGNKNLVAISGIVATAGTLVLLVTTIVPNLPLMYIAGIIIGLGAGLFMTTNWALGTDLAPRAEAGRYLGISNLAGAGAGMIGSGIGGPIADLVNRSYPGLGYFVIFGCYALLFFFSAVSLVKIRQEIVSPALA